MSGRHEGLQLQQIILQSCCFRSSVQRLHQDNVTPRQGVTPKPVGAAHSQETTGKAQGESLDPAPCGLPRTWQGTGPAVPAAGGPLPSPGSKPSPNAQQNASFCCWPTNGYFFRSHRYSAHQQQSPSWAKPARPRGLMSPRHTQELPSGGLQPPTPTCTAPERIQPTPLCTRSGAGLGWQSGVIQCRNISQGLAEMGTWARGSWHCWHCHAGGGVQGGRAGGRGGTSLLQVAL